MQQILAELLIVIGAGMLGGFLFPSVKGPFGIFEHLRESIGKPFTCPLCSGFWSAILVGIAIVFIPYNFILPIGAAGWVLFLHHLIGYNVIFEGMENLY